MLVFKPLLKVSVYTHGCMWKSELMVSVLNISHCLMQPLSLTSQRAPGIPVTVPSQHWDLRCTYVSAIYALY